MPVQQQNSSFARKLGSLVSAANAEHKDKPVDTGNRRLPSGIRNGVAKLSAMYTKEQTEDNGMVPKGYVFFRASAIVMAPESHSGEKVSGMVTQVIIPMCDVPAKGNRKATSFSENFLKFQNLFKSLGIMPPNEDEKSDPNGQRVEAYYFSAMKALTDPTHPVYISFSTRGWTPPATPHQPHPTEMVFETWHGLASATVINEINSQYTAGSGVHEMPPSTRPTGPTKATDNHRPINTVSTGPDGLGNPDGQITSPPDNLADEVAQLVDLATEDPGSVVSGGGVTASQRLEELAIAAGWTREQTLNAADWSEVGEMALSPLSTPSNGGSPVTVDSFVKYHIGSRWKFTRRTRDGSVMKNTKGVEFPAREVEVVTFDAESQTCTLRATDDNRMIIDMRTRNPLVVECKWLETI